MPCHRCERVRLDATTSYGYHAIDDDGLMQLGHSKDHRPDLPQIKLMAAAAEPSGLFLAGDVHPGNAADDPLYLPLYRRVRELLGQTGLLYAGDCKMAALETRAEIAACRRFLPDPAAPDRRGRDPVRGLGGGGADRRAGGEAGRDPRRGRTHRRGIRVRAVAIRRGGPDGIHLEGAGADHPLRGAWPRAKPPPWSGGWRKPRRPCCGLTPPPGPGRTQFTTGWELEQAVAAVLAEHEVEGLLEVSFERQETSRTKYVGRGRGGPNRPKTTRWDIRYRITAVRRDEAAIERRVARMGWQAQVTNVPEERLSLADSLLTYRGGWCGERLFHLLKDEPLGIRPLFVRRDDQIQGLTHLVTLALRVLMLFEVLVRRGQEQSGEKLKGLYPGQAKQVTDRPTAKRVLGGDLPGGDHADPGGQRW